MLQEYSARRFSWKPLVLAMPVFANGRIVAYSSVKGHLPDIGGGVFSSCDYTATEIIEEGLRIPPTKIYKAGQRNDDGITIDESDLNFLKKPIMLIS